MVTTHVALLANLTAVLHTVSPQFLGVNIDSASLAGETLPHRLNFQDEGLKQAAAIFANANYNGEGVKTTLRLGGSSAEALSFGDEPIYGCAITMDTTYWDTIAEFIREANLTLAFDLNSGNAAMRKILNGVNVWNSTNAERFLKYVAARPEQKSILGALQLGNEPGDPFNRNSALSPHSFSSTVLWDADIERSFRPHSCRVPRTCLHVARGAWQGFCGAAQPR